jgi:lambda repressor-like predicted transcriptional regulator
MKAYIRVMHFSGGKSPIEVETALKDLGFAKVKGTSTFEAEVADEVAGIERLEKVHQAFERMNVAYTPTLGRPSEPIPEQQMSYMDRMAKWRDAGLDVDELSELLQSDPGRFRSRGLEMMSAQLERVLVDREKGLREKEARERAEKARETILAAVRMEGGQTFHQLAELSNVDEDTLTTMLDDMVKKGKIVARQSGRRVAYVAI